MHRQLPVPLCFPRIAANNVHCQCLIIVTFFYITHVFAYSLLLGVVPQMRHIDAGTLNYVKQHIWQPTMPVGAIQGECSNIKHKYTTRTWFDTRQEVKWKEQQSVKVRLLVHCAHSPVEVNLHVLAFEGGASQGKLPFFLRRVNYCNFFQPSFAFLLYLSYNYLMVIHWTIGTRRIWLQVHGVVWKI